jgi:hypothetical protein
MRHASPTIAIGLLVATPILLWLGMVRPLVGAFDGRFGSVETSLLLDQQQAIGARRPGLLAEQEVLRGAAPDLAEFLTGANPSLAAAALQSRLTSLIKASGGSVTSTEALVLPDEEGFRRAGVRSKMTIQQDILPVLLAAIEGGRPQLFLSALSIKVAPNNALSLSFDMFGYLPPELP